MNELSCNNCWGTFYFGFPTVGDWACCAWAEVKGLGYEGRERATVGRAPRADQTEDQTWVEGQGPAGRAGRQQRTEGTEASHLRHTAHVMLHQQHSPSFILFTTTVWDSINPLHSFHLLAGWACWCPWIFIYFWLGIRLLFFFKSVETGTTYPEEVYFYLININSSKTGNPFTQACM